MPTSTSLSKSSDARSSENKPRVLFLASDCNPQWHSLPALIAEYFRSLIDYADLTLVTHVRNRENLESWLPDFVTVRYIDNEKLARPLYKLTRWLTGDPNKALTLQVALSYPSNIYFEYCVWREFKAELQAGEYDIVHRGSPMSPTIPSPMAKWSPVPFVIGPVLGGLPWPKQFKGEMRREGEWMNYFRAAHKCLPYYSSTYKYASAILAGYAHTMGDIPKRDSDRVVEFSEGGIHPEDFPERVFSSLEEESGLGGAEEKATILFVGRLVPFKQPEVLIRCVEKSDVLKKHRLVIVGDGPELPRLRSLVKALGLEKYIELTGTLPIEEVRGLMYQSDIFAFPSIREQGGGVLTMASMASVPCVVVDYGGPSCRVPNGCGKRIPLGPVESIIDGFVTALEAMVEDREGTCRLGIAARKFTQQFYSWEWKAKKTAEIYDWVLGGRPIKPDFWSEDVGAKADNSIVGRASRISF
ncbi:MAG: glycosyltransferase family 4 protein [Agarilytica sp.]